ncbi:MAG: GNAT family N-acetyltransferase [Arachidicoccus sp.]|nr:GNAT family N-acetyltransferase [Arachidicoccus sp.]
MNDKISLRNATESDYELMYQIKVNSIKPYVERVWGWEENFQREFLKENTPINEVKFILFEDKIAGFIQTKERDDEIFIGSIFIINDYQKKGIGTYLLKKILSRIRAFCWKF